MAIKGKGKTRAKQVARAPRREVVPVKPPFAQRTWVKATAAFIAGVFLVSMCWWVWENLDQDRNAQKAADARTKQQQTIQAWKAELQTDLADVAQVQGGSVPQIATTVQPALDALGHGKDPGVTAADMRTLAGQLDAAADKLAKFSVADMITEHDPDHDAFTADQVQVMTGAHAEIVAALRSFAVAAKLTGLALAAPKDQKDLVAAADEAMKTGQDLLTSGWTKYANASDAAGLPLALPQGLPAQSGS
jgi:hypothetical protein